MRHLRQRRARHGRQHGPAHPAGGHGPRGGGRRSPTWARTSRGWQAGDRVTFDSTIYCGQCYYCRSAVRSTCATTAGCWASPCDEYRPERRVRRVCRRAAAHPVPPAGRAALRARPPWSSRCRSPSTPSSATPAPPERHGRRRGRGHDRPARGPGAAPRRLRANHRRRPGPGAGWTWR